MNKRLENLFSPEKLRKKWENSPSIEAVETKNVRLKTSHDVGSLFNQVSHEVLNQYDGEKKEVLEIMLNEIKENLDLFVETDRKGGTTAADTGCAVIEQINQLEDLLDAF